MISVPRIYINFVNKRPKLFWAFVIIPIIIGLTAYYFIGGQASVIGGKIQAAGVIIVFHYVISLFLYRDYSNEKIQRVMTSWPIRVASGIIFTLMCAFLLFALYFFFTQSS